MKPTIPEPDAFLTVAMTLASLLVIVVLWVAPR